MRWLRVSIASFVLAGCTTVLNIAPGSLPDGGAGDGGAFDGPEGSSDGPRPDGPPLPLPAGVTLLAAGLQSATTLALSDADVYYAHNIQKGAISRVPKAGGAPVKIAEAVFPAAVAVGPLGVYWAASVPGQTPPQGNISRAAFDGGLQPPVLQVTGVPRSLSIRTGDVLFAVSDGAGEGVWSISPDVTGVAMRASPATVLRPTLVVAKGLDFFFAAAADGQIYNGPSPNTRSGDTYPDVSALAMSDARVAWANGAGVFRSTLVLSGAGVSTAGDAVGLSFDPTQSGEVDLYVLRKSGEILRVQGAVVTSFVTLAPCAGVAAAIVQDSADLFVACTTAILKISKSR